EQSGEGRNAREVRVTVIRGGASSNGYYYNEAVLRAIAGLLNSAQAYVDHARTEADSQVRSVRDIVGFYHSPAYIAGSQEPAGRVDATLHILESADWLWSMIYEACSLGHSELIGLSIDIFGTWQSREAAGTLATGRARPLKEVTGVLALNSCDIVTRPSAGGAFRHILQAQVQEERETHMNEHETQETALSTEPANATTSAAPATRGERQEGGEGRGTHILEQDIREMRSSLLDELRRERSQLVLERRLHESRLPEAALALVREHFAGRVFEEHELDAEIASTRKMLAALAANGQIRGQGYEKPEIGEQITEAEKLQAAFDALFGLEINTARLGNVRGFSSIREAYARVTGDPTVSGTSLREPELIRVDEAAPITRITEADTTTASFSYLLGTSMNKRLLKDYQAWSAEWQKFCTIVPIKDFKQQTRVRLGAFGSLATVAEDTAYSTISLTDTAATYVPAKRGNLVTVSRETIINDDLMAIKQIPTKLAVAAAYTLAEFVYAFLSSNANIYDGSALFTSGSPHNNLGSSALSTASMQTGVTAMREQTNFAGKRIGLRPRYLVVPPELEFTAMVVTKSAGVPGSSNNDINPMLGYVTPLVSPQLSSSTQWFFVADPAVVDTIEVGFVGGQVNPAMFIQDMPLYGLNFTNDVISYKVRQEYGGCVVDYRGLYRGI
ncbi:MAG TPA: Mu-like prophage major head subunit gpT family protein, partial [Acidobacteriaceae bacterium]